jgi:hypothetical protein
LYKGGKRSSDIRRVDGAGGGRRECNEVIRGREAIGSVARFPDSPGRPGGRVLRAQIQQTNTGALGTLQAWVQRSLGTQSLEIRLPQPRRPLGCAARFPNSPGRPAGRMHASATAC